MTNSHSGAAADHLIGQAFPTLTLSATTGETISPAEFSIGSFVLFIYPRTGRPDRVEPPEWSLVPWAKGCAPESCEFRDLSADYAAIGFRIYELSNQDTGYQCEAVSRWHLSYPLLSDPGFSLSAALGLPTFEFEGDRIHVRSTLVVQNGTITHAHIGVTEAASHPRSLLAQLQVGR
ncbi:peroxiredoxin [Paeniglutamicibacter kerguelensis]|uniref:Peroxiredoxin n=1 Tax=Paeniglutamicibacter kerguelensis TaxID=254788 RepID=A0ABS4X9J3_9MICC|nr:peroxiredoxin [Paeniglutamicibacter kerguelensis]MBP2385036.1 peroxiredoxin [Paeniglutamicibacter kerguelensis]